MEPIYFLSLMLYIVLVVHTQVGNCITTRTTVCGDGPESCVVVTETECWQ